VKADVSEPSVSVVIPTYQRCDLVPLAVTSALEQTSAPSEVIVIDDGSTDGTEDALAPIADRIIYRRQPNRGASAARNAGLQLATGSIVAFLDADDRWFPHHLAVLTAAIERNPAASLACSGPVHPHLRRARHVTGSEIVDALYALLPGFGLLTTPSRVVVRREALEEVNGFDEELIVAEDSDLWVRLAIRAPFVLSPEVTIVRGKDDRSLARRGMRESLYLPAFQRQAEKHLSEIESHRPDDADARSHAKAQQHHARALIALIQGRGTDCRAELTEAIALVKWLSEEPELIGHRIARLGPPEHAHLRFAEAAASWPEAHSETALFLRASAFGGALRGRDLRSAAGVLTDCPLRAKHRLLGLGFRRTIRGENWLSL
jgi:GT2 family glycosyltransferase